MDNINLELDERKILETTNVICVAGQALQVNRMILTDRNLYFTVGSGESEKTIKRSLKDIRLSEGVPQVDQLTSAEQRVCLRISFNNGNLLFFFQDAPEQESTKWEQAIRNAFKPTEDNDAFDILAGGQSSGHTMHEQHNPEFRQETSHQATQNGGFFNQSADPVKNTKQKPVRQQTWNSGYSSGNKKLGVIFLIIDILVLVVGIALGSVDSGNSSKTEKSISESTSISTSSTSKEEKEDSLKLAKTGYTVLKKDSLGDVYATYAVQIENTSSDKVPALWQLTVTVKSKDGKVLGTTDEYIPSIKPGEKAYMAGELVNCKGHEDARLEFKIAGSDFESGDGISENDFKAKNVTYVNDDMMPSVTGEIENKKSSDVDSAEVVIVFKKGDKLVGGGVTYVENIPAGGSVPFEYSDMSSVPAYDKIIVTAYDLSF